MMTELYTAEAVKFIEQNKSRRFFLYLAHTMPHLPLGISDRFRGKSNAGLYGDVIECLDWSVGTILETLRKNELRQKTLVIFTSDNGPEKNTDGSSGPLRGRKHTTYEGGLRVPLIAWGPGLIPTGKTCAELTCAMDLYPTFAQLAGAGRATNHVIDGCDILPLLRGQVGAVSPHKTFFYYGDGGQLEAVRSGRWKLFLKAQPELYDLAEDLGESKNLAAQNSNEVAQLRQLGRAFVDEMKLNARPAGQGVRAVVR
jgi:arylsulfatase A-like enzyme